MIYKLSLVHTKTW